MAATVSKSPILTALLRKDLAEIETIRVQAEQVVFGFITSISALSQSTTYTPDNAAVVLDACNDAIRMKEAEAAGERQGTLPANTLGHTMRFQPVINPPGMTWGC